MDNPRTIQITTSTVFQNEPIDQELKNNPENVDENSNIDLGDITLNNGDYDKSLESNKDVNHRTQTEQSSDCSDPSSSNSSNENAQNSGQDQEIESAEQNETSQENQENFELVKAEIPSSSLDRKSEEVEIVDFYNNLDKIPVIVLSDDDDSVPETSDCPQTSAGNKRSSSSSPQEIANKRQKRNHDSVELEDEPTLDNSKIQLSWFDSDLNLQINKENFVEAKNLATEGLGLMWAGVRANYGAFKNGKYFYEVQLTSKSEALSHLADFKEKNLHEFRCGWSTADSTNLQLGETAFSYGLDSSGMKCCNGSFSSFTEKFGLNDIIGVYLVNFSCLSPLLKILSFIFNLFQCIADSYIEVRYTINGKNSGVAFLIKKSSLERKALFPHIATKNYEFR